MSQRRQFLKNLLGATLSGAAFPLIGCDVQRGGSARTVYLVRHAEKQVVLTPGPEAKDPPLTDRGRRRAQGLARALAHVEIGAIFATEYRRTQQTVEPCAASRELAIQIVGAGDTAALIQKIHEHANTGALVCGHGNTVPLIAQQLGIKERINLGEPDYGDLFVLRLQGDQNTSVNPTLERRRFEP